MARSLSNPNFLAALVDGASASINRRGYAAATEGVGLVAANLSMASGTKRTVIKAGEEMVRPATSTTTIMEGEPDCKFWIPDPVTGYYRPENAAGEIDPVDLRQRLLRKTKQN